MAAFITVGVSAFVGPGCGTIGREGKHTPYGGILMDGKMMVKKPASIPIWVIDFPFSFVADTLLLPSDIYHQFPHVHSQSRPETLGPVSRPKSGEKSSSPAH